MRQRRMRNWIGTLLGLTASLFLWLGFSAAAGASAPTGYDVAPIFQQFYTAHGGVRIFGYPISPPVDENGRLVQYFERQRLEYHPELERAGFSVLPGLVGREAAAIEGRTFGPAAPQPGLQYFPQTSHNLDPHFADFWARNGDVLVFGYPISEGFTENGVLVQYFERARFEYHPEFAGTPNEIELGLLGRVVWEQQSHVVHFSSLSLAEQLAAALNEARQQNGLPPLTLDPALIQIAQLRSDDMAQRNYFSHTTPEGTTVFDLFGQWGIRWSYGGETIQRNNFPIDQTAAEAARSLLASAPHRAIILDPRFSLFGVAERTSADGMHYYTVVFVQP